jgi:hypothetical protein
VPVAGGWSALAPTVPTGCVVGVAVTAAWDGVTAGVCDGGVVDARGVVLVDGAVVACGVAVTEMLPLSRVAGIAVLLGSCSVDPVSSSGDVPAASEVNDACSSATGDVVPNPGDVNRGTGVQAMVACPAPLSICAGVQITMLLPPVSSPLSVSESIRTTDELNRTVTSYPPSPGDAATFPTVTSTATLAPTAAAVVDGVNASCVVAVCADPLDNAAR